MPVTEEMWKSGRAELTAVKLGRIKQKVRGGGELWLGTDPDEPAHTLLLRQGHAEHGRTSR